MGRLSQLLARFRQRRAAAPPSYFLSHWVFLRLLGLVYLVAFVSLWVQVEGLIGSGGILPVNAYLPAVKDAYDPEPGVYPFD